MYRENFSSRIKSLRARSEFTLRQVEQETGIKYTTIAKYENGTLEPDIEKLGTLADFYEVSLDWLIGTGIRKNINKTSYITGNIETVGSVGNGNTVFIEQQKIKRRKTNDREKEID